MAYDIYPGNQQGQTTGRPNGGWDFADEHDRMRRLDDWFRHDVLQGDNAPREGPLPAGRSYKDFDANQIWHMAFIQNVIRRMSDCSFSVKKWSIAAAPLAIGAAASMASFARGLGGLQGIIVPLLALLPTLFLWWMDAYYLRQERIFRALYKAVCDGNPHVAPFSFNIGAVLPPSFGRRWFVGDLSWCRAWCSLTVLVFHGALFLVVLFCVLCAIFGEVSEASSFFAKFAKPVE